MTNLDESLVEIERRLKKINKIAADDTLVSPEKDRIEVLIDACDITQITQQNFLTYKRAHKDGVQAMIEFDYKLSSLADRCFMGADETLAIYVFPKEYIATAQNRREKTKRMRQAEELQTVPIEMIALLEELRIKMLEISARWHTRRFMEYWDIPRPDRQKKLPKRLPLLKDAMFYYDRSLSTKLGIKQKDGIEPREILFATQPSSGKTYLANTYTCLSLILHQIYYGESGLIRLTNTQTNAYKYGSQVKSMLKNPSIVKIFPEWEKYYTAKNEVRPFKIDNQETFLLKDCNDEIQDSLFMLSAGTSVNGKRAMCATIIDDLSGGMQDMYNDELHKQQTEFVMGDIADRSDNSEEMPMIYQGTFYNEYDIQNSILDLWTDNYDLKQIKHENGVNVYATPNYRRVAILVDCYNDNMESIAPGLVSTDQLRAKQEFYEKREKPFVFDLIYRQKKASRLPRTFDWNNLLQYDELPEDLSNVSWGALDPTRKAEANFFSLPILQYSKSKDKYYLTDAIFQQKSLGKVADPNNEFKNEVVKKLISCAMTNLYIENNVSNTLSDVLDMELRHNGWTVCNIEEAYTAREGRVSNKLSRILEYSTTIMQHIVFPSKKYLQSHNKPDLSRFMDKLTGWNSKGRQNDDNPDDAPDSLAMFVAKYVFPYIVERVAHIDYNLDFNPLRVRRFF